MDKEWLGLVGGVIAGITYVIYISDILRGTCRPKVASWIVFAAADCLALYGMWHGSATNPMAWISAVGATATLVLALKFGTAGWNIIDKICVAIASIGLTLFVATDTAEVAVVASAIVCVLAIVPTLISTWEDPSRESRFAWLFGFIGILVALHGIPTWTLVAAGQLVAFTICNFAQVMMLYFMPTSPRSYLKSAS